MGDEWLEEGSPSESITFRFDGVDQDAKDDLDGKNLVRRLRWSRWFGLGGKPNWAGWFALATALAGTMFLALFARAYQLLFAVLSLVMLSAPLIVAFLLVRFVVRELFGRPLADTTRDRFTVRMSAKELACSGERSPSRSIDAGRIVGFVGNTRLSARLADGSTITLPCSLPHRDNSRLAAELDARLREMRAIHGGYRGEPLHARVALEEPDAEDVAEEEQVRASRR